MAETQGKTLRAMNVESAIFLGNPITKDWGNPRKTEWKSLLDLDDKQMTKSQTIAWAIKKMTQMQEDIDRNNKAYVQLYKCYRKEVYGE
jgi:hypothetical protein